jgi:DNA (cytosine-5)-methyltransferase 1
MLAGNRRDGTQDKAYISEADFSLPLDCSGQNPDRWQGGTGVAQTIAHVEVCGTLSDGAHHGGGLNGQDAYTGRILPVVPYDLFQITAPINPCHTLARDNAAHAAVVQPIAFSAKDYGGDASVDVSPTLRAGGHAASHENGGVGPAIAFDARQTDVCVYGDKTGPLDTDGSSIGVMVHPMAFAQNQLGEVRASAEVFNTINTNSNASGRNTPMLAQSMSVRRLTPTECERLQGFPDGWTAISWKRKPASECPDGPRYRALGNSMAVNVMRWIGRRIELVEKT